MKKILTLGITAVLLCAGLMVSVAAAAPKGIDVPTDYKNCYTLNLIAKDKDTFSGGLNDNEGHRIFVPLYTEGREFELLDGTMVPGIKIQMTQADEGFSVLDANAIDDGVASLQIGPGRYQVFIVVKAKKPHVDAVTDINSWIEFTEPDGSTSYALFLDTVSVSKSKQQQWEEITDLFYVPTSITSAYTGTDNDGNVVTYDGDGWVFEYLDFLGDYGYTDLDYFWQLQNSGNKNVQVRFYGIK